MPELLAEAPPFPVETPVFEPAADDVCEAEIPEAAVLA